MDTINSRNVDRVTLVSREPNTQEKIGKMDTELSFDKFFQNADNLQGVEEIGKYLQKLDSTFSELSVENIKLIDGLFGLLLSLGKKLDEIEKQGRLSEKTKKLAKSIEDAVNDLLEKLRKNKNFDLKNDSSLQYDLDEAVIGLAIQRLGEVLGAGATPILVGVNKYSQNQQELEHPKGYSVTQPISDLQGPINDTRAVEEKLTRFYRTKPPNVLLDEQATKENILSNIRSSPKDKPIFLYFAGHGIDGYLMPFIQKGDVVLKNDDLLKKSIAPEELYDAIGSRKAVVIVDKCFGGLLVSKAPKNIHVISATDKHNVALESVSDKLSSIDNGRNVSEVRLSRLEGVRKTDMKSEYRGAFTYFLTRTNEGFDFRTAIKQLRDFQNPQFGSTE